MPSPYNLIQQARLKQKRETGRSAEQWTALQSKAPSKQMPVTAPEPLEPPMPVAAPSKSRHAHIDAIHKRHNQALKGASFQPIGQPAPFAPKAPVQEEGKT